MTIEIQELIIKARVEEGGLSGKPALRPQSAQSRSEQNFMIDQIVQQVLERLRDKQEGWA